MYRNGGQKTPTTKTVNVTNLETINRFIENGTVKFSAEEVGRLVHRVGGR